MTEVRALYGHLSCGWLGGVCAWRHATLGSGRGWLGAVIARQTTGRNGRSASTGGFLVYHNSPNWELLMSMNKCWQTCCPSPQYIHITILSNKPMSSFWLKSNNFDACSISVDLWHAMTMTWLVQLRHTADSYRTLQKYMTRVIYVVLLVR